MTDGINCGGNVSVGSGNVFIGDNPTLMQPVGIEPEFKSVILRLNIDTTLAKDSKDQFVLKATDNSYSSTKTVQNDMVPGDNYLDLLYENVDTSKFYALEHKHAADGTVTHYFQNISYLALSKLSS